MIRNLYKNFSAQSLFLHPNNFSTIAKFLAVVMECTRHETIINKTPCRRSLGPHAIAEWVDANGDIHAMLITCKEIM